MALDTEDALSLDVSMEKLGKVAMYTVVVRCPDRRSYELIMYLSFRQLHMQSSTSVDESVAEVLVSERLIGAKVLALRDWQEEAVRQGTCWLTGDPRAWIIYNFHDKVIEHS